MKNITLLLFVAFAIAATAPCQGEWFLTVTDQLNPETNTELGIVAYNSEEDDSLWVAQANSLGYYVSWQRIYKSAGMRVQAPPVALAGAMGIYIPPDTNPRQILFDGYNGGYLNPIRRRLTKLSMLMLKYRYSPNIPWPPQ